MTTLPQTTPMRLPRPSGAGQIAIPSAGGNGALGAYAGAAGGGGVQMTGADVWRVLRSNLWLILGMVAVAAVGGFFANRYLATHHPKYTANGVVSVQLAEEVFRADQNEMTGNVQSIELEVKTRAQGLRSPALMAQALENDKIRQTEWFREMGSIERQKEDLLDNFRVQPVLESRLISVEMTYRNPADARVIVEEVVNRYIENLKSGARDDWRVKAQNLEGMLAQYDREYREIGDQLTRGANEFDTQDLVQLFALIGSKRYEMDRATDQFQKAEQARVEAQNEFDAFNALLSGGETPPEIETKVFQDLAISQTQMQLDELDARIAQLGSGNPQAGPLRARYQSLERRRDDRREMLRSAYINEIRHKLDTELKQAKGAAENAQARIEDHNKQLREMQAAATTYKNLEEQQRDIREKMDKVKDELATIQNRKVPSGWAPVDWSYRPPTPDTPSFPKLPMVMSVAVLLGLALSVGIAFLREITDTTVRSPRDIARVGNMNLLGMVPHESDDPQAAGARLPLVIFDAPHSMAAEEFRKLRTRLQHAASLDSTRSILVSSANPGDGKTVVACNLAAGLALNGRRILLVDANFRRPEIHTIFEVANERGLGDALNDLSTFDTLVRDTPVQNLFVMPTGPKPVNATELLESQLLIDFIERALEDYDHVIFDSGPLLIVSETMALAPRVDGVVTVARARANSRGVLQRMRDALRQVKAEHLGVVLNAVRSQGGGYYGRNIKTYYAYQNG